MGQSHIRNFCIIAHIDHGKSTLADRMLSLTGTIAERDMKSQMLDVMELEQERGITIKLQPVRMDYKDCQLNLIDTPGHVDFSYEVSRSLAACEGAILVVDASQGIQAQTLANVYLALEADLTIIPVLNKIDLPAADVEASSLELINLLGCDESDIIKVSAKTGQNIDQVLDAIIERVPAPTGKTEAPTRALIFDSYYDDYRGVVLYVRVVDGSIKRADQIEMLAAEASGLAVEVGSLSPSMHAATELKTGEIGYIVTNLKTTRQARVGDTVTISRGRSDHALPGYKEVHPFVYAGFFPVSNEDYNNLKDAVDKLALSDSALRYEPENSPVLGFGVRIGFLGLLHLDIIRERLEREYDLELVVTNPSTDYHVNLTNGDELDIKSAADLPEVASIAEIREPWINGEIVVPKDYVGAVLQLIASKRGRQKNLSYIDERALVSFEAPLANLLTDFYDQLKSVTSGYGSFNYELNDYRAEDLVRLDFYVAGEIVDSLSVMVHRSEAEALGREVVKKLKDVIPRQNFKVALQAAIGGRFIAREDLSAYRKDVTTGLYGGDVSRKKKVLAKQKKGKARMKRFGKVDIPSEAFTVMLKRD
ncbi:MAG TPA: translation elongation factor 4 [Candidatus Saccharimonadales bacterium]|nr:translation elongation factor 4 [Candidatus Saccharimonadales bacterium]